jgi:NAD(P)-dependent dehydrogenase (short-subunit alcohol dehydrogenase family)
MVGPFGSTSTTDDVLSGKDLSGKRVLVTGVSAGLGVETARALAAHGAQVVGAARDLAKAKRATAEVRSQAANGGGLELVELDLASLENVRACADALVADGRPFDVVIANAGVMRTLSLPETHPRSYRPPFVAMMESADLRDGDDFALLRPLDGAASRRVPGEGEVAPGVMVIPQVRPKDPAQVLLVEHDDVVEALPADRADHTLGVRILPG